jgi:hypothetical protein
LPFGLFLRQYERVCGNKGYSYNAYNDNEKVKKDGYNVRGSDVPAATSEQIGWDDCDYIALEQKGTWWGHHIPDEMWPLELHVPCRDPLDHLMSAFNMKHLTFDCNTDNMVGHIWTAWKWTWYDGRLPEPHPNITVKCFDPMPPTKYVNYMGSILQHKRIVSEYAKRDTNRHRNKTQECIWQETEEFRDNLRRILREKFKYYEYCHHCMGSKDELVLDQ